MARILIADGDQDMRQHLAACCEPGGHTVVQAASAREALAIVKRDGADVVVTRFFMPEPDGFDLVLSLLGRTPRPAIVAVTEGDRFVSGRGLQMSDRLGVDAVLTKPHTPATVLGALEEVLK